MKLYRNVLYGPTLPDVTCQLTSCSMAQSIFKIFEGKGKQKSEKNEEKKGEKRKEENFIHPSGLELSRVC